MLENRWHELPCGATLRVLNGVGTTVVVSVFRTDGFLPPTDEVVLQEASELLGHKVALRTRWTCDVSGMYRTAELKPKQELDDPMGI